MNEKYTKKASARILKEVLKVNPKASGFTSLDQAFVILMEHWDMEISMEKSGDKTTCILHRDDDKPMTWDFDKVWNDKEGDWDWNTIYKVVLETIIKEKLYKRPKLGKRAMKKLAEERAIRKRQEEEATRKEEQSTKPTTKPNIQSLKDQRSRLAARISNAKKKGADYSALEVEYNKIREQLKNLK